MHTRLIRLGALAVLCLALLGTVAAKGLPEAFNAVELAGGSVFRQAPATTPDFEAIASRTAELRGLAPLGEVQRTSLTPDQFRARMVAELDDPDSRESIEKTRRLLVALGLLEPTVDLYALELEFRTGVVLGQYDPETKQLYVISGNAAPGQLERVTLAHEFTHALQDQHYDIRRLMPKHSDNSDRDVAISALLEGDALLSEELYQAHAMTRAEQDEKRRQERALGSSLRLDRLPQVIVEETYFPYVMGPRFIRASLGADAVRSAVQSGSAYGSLVQRLFDNPPTSSAQIMHPDKYLSGVQPAEVALPDLAGALGDGWTQLRQDLLGELDHRILIQQFGSREGAERAADGWAGDAFALLGNGDQTAVVISSRWDTPKDAQEWFLEYAQALRARYPQTLQTVEERSNRLVWRSPDGMQLLRLDGTDTAVVLAPAAADVARLEQALSPARGAVLTRLVPRAAQP